MKTLQERIEENLTLLETNQYTPIVKTTMLKRCAGLLADYEGKDWEELRNRLIKVEYTR